MTGIGDYAFCWCHELEEVVLPESLKRIGTSAFDSCGTKADPDDTEEPERSLTVNLPSGLESIGERAFGYSGIKCITIPKGVKDLVRAFDGSAIESIDLGAVEEIGEYTFHHCWGLKTIKLPNTLEVIGEHAFEGAGITEIIIPEGVTTLGKDYQYPDEDMAAFVNCYDLKRVVLPSTLEFIIEDEFYGCKLEEIDYGGTKEQWDALMSNIGETSSLGQLLSDNKIKIK